MYDKYARVLRIETTVNDVSFFKHHRRVEHRDGPSSANWRPEEIDLQPDRSAPDPPGMLSTILGVSVRAGRPQRRTARARRLTDDRCERDRPIKGLNFFKRTEQELLRGTATSAVQYPRTAASRSDGFVPGSSPAAFSRELKRRRMPSA